VPSISLDSAVLTEEIKRFLFTFQAIALQVDYFRSPSITTGMNKLSVRIAEAEDVPLLEEGKQEEASG